MSAMQDAPAREQRTYRSRPTWQVAVALAVAPALVAVGVIGAVVGDTPYWSIMAFLVAVILLSSLRTLGAWYGTTEVDDQGATVSSRGTSVVIPWAELAVVEVSPPSWLGRVVAVRTHGATRAKALPAPRVGMFGSRERFAADVEQLVGMIPAHVEVVDRDGSGRAGRRPLLLRAVSMAMFLLLVMGCVFMGLLVLWATQPWNSPRWPGRHEASITPQACALDPALVQPLVAGAGDGQPEDSTTTAVSDATACAWVSPDGETPNQSLYLTITRQLWIGSSNATVDAAETVRVYREQEYREVPFQPLSGVGDEAWVADTPDPVNAGLRIVARRANVWIDVVYHSDAADPGADPQRRRAAATAVARAALDAVAVD
ncbi:MAG TPA: hypothetical protein VK891_16045 [Euzebyales bacterium]|nr:hypothetical protein [Euzebyales bacterium]